MKNMIREAAGEGEVIVFMSNHGLTARGGDQIKSHMQWRLQRVNELITRVDQLSIRDNFDPAKWRNTFLKDEDGTRQIPES